MRLSCCQEGYVRGLRSSSVSMLEEARKVSRAQEVLGCFVLADIVSCRQGYAARHCVGCVCIAV